MRSFLIAALVVCSVAWASLSSLKRDIDHDLRRLVSETNAVTERCVQLERDIPNFNKQNEAANNAKNATLAGKRAELALVTDQFNLAKQIETDLRARYNATRGEIDAKKAAIAALRGNFLAELRARRTALTTERTAVLAEKRALERRLRDLDNFANATELRAAQDRFFVLRDRAETLASMISALNDQISNPVIPNLQTLQNELAVLEARGAAEYAELRTKTAQVNALNASKTALEREIARLESAAGGFSNFVIPAICNTL